MIFHGQTFDFGEDYGRLKNNTQRVFATLMDGEWHTASELREVGGERWSARVRQLREPQMGGLIVEAERLEGGVWKYRLDLESLTAEKALAIVEWTVDASHKRDIRKRAKETRGLASQVMATLEGGRKRTMYGLEYMCIPISEARALWMKAKRLDGDSDE